MANKNTKQYRSLLSKEKSAVTCVRVRTAPGGNLVKQSFTLSYGNPGRKSHNPKVAAKGGGGPSLMEQSKSFYGNCYAIK